MGAAAPPAGAVRARGALRRGGGGIEPSFPRGVAAAPPYLPGWAVAAGPGRLHPPSSLPARPPVPVTGAGGAAAADWLRASHAAGPGRAGAVPGWAGHGGALPRRARQQRSPFPAQRPVAEGTAATAATPRRPGHEVGPERRHLCGEVSGAPAPSSYPRAATAAGKRRGWRKEKGIFFCFILYRSIFAAIDPDPATEAPRREKCCAL